MENVLAELKQVLKTEYERALSEGTEEDFLQRLQECKNNAENLLAYKLEESRIMEYIAILDAEEQKQQRSLLARRRAAMEHREEI